MEELADAIFISTFIVEAKRSAESLETFYKNKFAIQKIILKSTCKLSWIIVHVYFSLCCRAYGMVSDV